MYMRTQISDYRDMIIDYLDVYFSLVHRYKMSPTKEIWAELSDLEEEIDRMRILLFKSDKIASKYVRNKYQDESPVIQSIPQIQQKRDKVYYAARETIS